MAKSRKQHPESDTLRRGIDRCLAHLKAFSGVMYRAVSPAYANSSDLLTGEGAKKHGARWNPPGLFCAVYGSLGHQAALEEALGNYQQYGIPAAQRLPLTTVGIDVKLKRVLDFTDGTIRQHLGVSEDRMLKTDWQAAQTKHEEGLTQAIGRLAWEATVEALLVWSARVKKEKNLVIFPEQLCRPSRLIIVNENDLPATR